MKTEIFLAARFLFRGKARHVSFIGIISCVGIVLGVSTLIVVMAVMNGFDQELMEKLLRFNYHITIESLDRPAVEEIINEVKATAGVESVAIFLQTQVFAKVDNLIVPLAVRGIDFNDPDEQRIFKQYILEDSGQDGFFVGQALKNKFFLADRIEYYPLKKKLKLKKDVIRGVFKIGLYDVDSNYLVCNLDKAKLLSDNYLLFLGLMVSDPFDVDIIRGRLNNLTGRGFIVNTWVEANQALFSALRLEKFTMFIILSLIIVVASFNIFATLSVKVVEKTKDIGILKSLGFTSRKILSIFSMQGILLGLIGVILGVGLGLLLCFMLKEYQFIKIPQEIYYIEYLPVSFNPKDIVMISLLGVILSFLSSLLPALRASSLRPCEALRYE